MVFVEGTAVFIIWWPVSVCHLCTVDFSFAVVIRFDHHYTRALYLTLYKMNQHNIIAVMGWELGCVESVCRSIYIDTVCCRL